ncbi:hypothetical protein [Hoeflea sp. BAL378]|uniref:hypothetical protein n=1 Tax=Hoeflea sp. BAL378 TaxID=1547437 RepID=UPI000A4862A8|nr:hypothetical protein [Hoeflea sp. BAL378]
MSFRSINQHYLVPAAQGLMIFGIISLCQPWSEFLHTYGVTMTLFGLIAFMITSKIAPDPEDEESYLEESLDVLEINDHAGKNGSKTAGSF